METPASTDRKKIKFFLKPSFEFARAVYAQPLDGTLSKNDWAKFFHTVRNFLPPFPQQNLNQSLR